MVAVLIVSILFALVAAAAVIFAQRQRLFFWALKEAEENEDNIPRLHPVTLFAVPDAATLARIERDEHHQKLMAEREKLFAWASLVEFAHLPDAPPVGDHQHFQDAFHILIDRAQSDEEICALVAFVLKHQNPNVNHNLVDKYLQIWNGSPGFRKTANLFQLVVLTKDADLFLSILVETEQAVRTGSLFELDSSELYELAESHYWLLPEAARISGAGFMLKQKLASLRREITDHNTRRN